MYFWNKLLTSTWVFADIKINPAHDYIIMSGTYITYTKSYNMYFCIIIQLLWNDLPTNISNAK